MHQQPSLVESSTAWHGKKDKRCNITQEIAVLRIPQPQSQPVQSQPQSSPFLITSIYIITRLLHLPLELLDMIMHHAMISRGVTIALRLRLVCSKQFFPLPPSLYSRPDQYALNRLKHRTEPFSYSVDRTLFLTRLLDDKKSTEFLRRWDFRRHHYAADKLWHDYLVFRYRDKLDESIAYYVGIRENVDALAPHIDRQDNSEGSNDSVPVPTWDNVLDKLYWLAMGCTQTGNCTPYYGSRWHARNWWEKLRKWREQRYSPDRTELINTGPIILSAATYLGYTSLW